MFRTQHVYNILLLRHLVGLFPEDFLQIVDYGGGTGNVEWGLEIILDGQNDCTTSCAIAKGVY